MFSSVSSTAFIPRLLCTDEFVEPMGLGPDGVRTPSATVWLAAEGTLSEELGVTPWLRASVLDLSQSVGSWEVVCRLGIINVCRGEAG